MRTISEQMVPDIDLSGNLNGDHGAVGEVNTLGKDDNHVVPTSYVPLQAMSTSLSPGELKKRPSMRLLLLFYYYILFIQ